MTYFLDANILSYILKNIPSVISRLSEIIKNGNEIRISSIAYYEVKRGLLANKATNKLSMFEYHSKLFGIVPLSQSALDRAAEEYAKLKQQGLLIEDDDLFIGCSALENNAILLTNNMRHLERIEGLRIETIK